MLKEEHNTFTPHWATAWSNVPLQAGLGVRVELQDADLQWDDHIGSVLIGYAALVDALHARVVHPIAKHEQDTGQILFVTVLVTESY